MKNIRHFLNLISYISESEFNEFEPRLKSTKNRFQLRAGLNLEKLNRILNRTTHIWAAAQVLLIRPLAPESFVGLMLSNPKTRH